MLVGMLILLSVVRYKLNSHQIIDNKGRLLLARHGRSPLALLEAVYPEVKFLPWLFSSVPKGFWEQRQNRQWYVDWLLQRLGVGSTLAELTIQHFYDHNGAGLFRYCGRSVKRVLASLKSDNFPGRPRANPQ